MLIYKIKNKINGKIYIGQTIHSLEFRISNYKKEYKYCKKERPIINAMKKYGFDNFEFTILKDNISNKKELDDSEIYFIKYFNSTNKNVGYNLENGGNSVGKHSASTKQKISNSQKGVLNHMYGKKGALNKSSKKVICLNNGEIFESANLAAQKYDLNFSHVCACCRGTRATHKGYTFRYLDKNNQIIIPKQYCRIKKISDINNILQEYIKYV